MKEQSIIPEHTTAHLQAKVEYVNCVNIANLTGSYMPSILQLHTFQWCNIWIIIYSSFINLLQLYCEISKGGINISYCFC